MWARALLCLVWISPWAYAQPPITALCFTPDQNQLLVGSQAGLELKSWPELETVSRVETEVKHINDLAFSPDGKTLLVAGGAPSEYGELVALAWPDKTPLFASAAHDDVIHAVTWLDDQHCASAAADNRVIVWKVGEPGFAAERQLTGHSRRVLAVGYLRSHQLLLTAGVDQTVRVWQTGQLVRVLDNHTGIVRDIAVRPGEQALPYIATASEDRTVRLWQPTIGRMVRFARLPAEPLSVAWSKEGTMLAVGCIDGTLRMVNPNTVRIEAEFEAIDGWAYEVVAAPDGSFVVGGSAGQLVRIDPLAN